MLVYVVCVWPLTQSFVYGRGIEIRNTNAQICWVSKFINDPGFLDGFNVCLFLVVHKNTQKGFVIEKGFKAQIPILPIFIAKKAPPNGSPKSQKTALGTCTNHVDRISCNFDPLPTYVDTFT